MRGQPAYTALGGVSLELIPEVFIDNAWKSVQEAGIGTELTWSNNRLDLSTLREVTRVKLTFAATFDLDKYEKAYSLATVEKDLQFSVRQWNVASRTRKLLQQGTVTVKPKSGANPARLQCSLGPIEMDLSVFNGEIELQPLILAVKTMVDRNTKGVISVHKSGILGWTDPLTIVIDRARAGIDSMFEFKWVSFKDDMIPGLNDSEYFAIRWQARPILYLNRDIEGLEDVLTCLDRTGKRARARDTINAGIAQIAVTVALTTSVYAAREIKLQSPQLDADEVSDLLSALERMVITQWVHAIDFGSGGRSTPWKESLERLITMDEDEVQRAITELLPQNLQGELGSKKSISELLNTFMERTVE